MTTRIIAIILLIILAFWVILPMLRKEGFDADMREFVPVGSPRYGLRGNLLNTIPISVNYIRPDQDVMLSQTGGEMWVSNFPPQGKNCDRVECPGWYDKSDQCWKCEPPQVHFTIPDIAPHVPN